MKRTISPSIVYIPSEVFTQILVSSPAKSLLRFRCVCKSWCSIIDDPNFVNMQLQFCNNNKINSDKLLSLETLGLCGENGCLLTLCKADTLCKIDDIFKSSESYIVQGSCNSLVLLSFSRYSLGKGMRLCNPSIRKSLLLPNCPLLPRYEHRTTYVLGSGSPINGFKVIAITFKRPGVVTPGMRLAVYTLDDQRWAVRDNGFNSDCLSKTRLIGPYYFCHGAAHWLGEDTFENSFSLCGRPTHLVSLDFITESFTFLELPVLPHALHVLTKTYLFLLGDSLAFFCISSVNVNIWVLKQESGKREWSLWFAGPSSSDGFSIFYQHWGFTKRVLYYKGDGGSLIYGNKSYNIATCQVKSIAKSPSHCVELETYSESLVLGKGYGAEDTASSIPVLLDT